jgi:hypothetical protein
MLKEVEGIKGSSSHHSVCVGKRTTLNSDLGGFSSLAEVVGFGDYPQRKARYECVFLVQSCECVTVVTLIKLIVIT